MNQVLRKKINVLVHLANADGHFDVSEKAFLKDLLQEHGIDHHRLDSLKPENIDDVHTIVEKEQVLYWALQLIKADGEIHDDELAFCKAMALKLKFVPGVIDEYAHKQLPEFQVFKKEVDPFKMFSVRD
jgi:tellurite resistance protein